MKISKQWLKKHRVCYAGYKWFCNQELTKDIDVISQLIKEEKTEWAWWILKERLNKKQSLQVAIYMAKKAVRIYKDCSPNEKIMDETITATKNYLNNPCAKTELAATIAADKAIEVGNEAALKDYTMAYAAYTSGEAAAFAGGNSNLESVFSSYSITIDTIDEEILIIKYGLSLLKKNNKNL